MAEPIADILARRGQKSREVQRLFQQFNQAFSELCAMDDTLNPRLASLTEALYGSTVSSQDVDTAPSYTITGNTLIRRETKFELLQRIVIPILKERGPLQTLELFRLVEAAGFDVGGKKPISNMGAHLSHSKIIIKGDRGWQLREPPSQMETPTSEGGG